MRRGFWMSLFLIALCTACPETWRKGGRIDRALAKDIKAEWRKRQRPRYCNVTQDNWVEECGDIEEGEEPDACRPECGP